MDVKVNFSIGAFTLHVVCRETVQVEGNRWCVVVLLYSSCYSSRFSAVNECVYVVVHITHVHILGSTVDSNDKQLGCRVAAREKL